MKILIVDDQFNRHDGMPLSSSFNLHKFLERNDYSITYGTEWKYNLATPEVLCYAPEGSHQSVISVFREIICFTSSDPDLILIDICLLPDNEDTTGIDLLGEIRERDQEVPVIIMSAFDRISTVNKHKLAFRAGKGDADYFLSKRDLAENPDIIFHYVKDINAYNTDRVQQKLSNLISEEVDGYDLMECANLGTVAFFLQEDYALMQSIDKKMQSYSSKAPLNLIDIGCGTGRFEELLFGKYDDRIKITAIDMASGMLRTARQKTILAEAQRKGQLILDRGFAEYYKSNSLFDFAIMGFGFLSYCDSRRVLNNLRKNLLKDDGLLFVTFYQYDSAYYDIWEEDIFSLLKIFYSTF